MATVPRPTAPVARPLVPTMAGKVIQSIQGCYYLAAGLLLAVFPDLFRQVTGPSHDLSHAWLARLVGLAVAVCGVALVRSGRRARGPFVWGGAAMIVAFGLFVVGVLGTVTGVFPHVVLLDSGLELLFAMWWAAVMSGRMAKIPDTMPGAAAGRQLPGQA